MPDRPLTLTLFGGFKLQSASMGAEIGLGKKAQGLLAYLAQAKGHAANREKLAALLWDDRGEQQARQSLRQAISAVRKALGEIGEQEGSEILKSEGEGLSLEPAFFEIDSETFSRLADQPDTGKLAEALTLFTGELLQDIGSVSDAFDTWLMNERRHLNELAARTMDTLATQDTDWAASSDAKDVAERLATLDPFCEPATRVMIANALLNGQTATATRMFREFKDLLATELETEPEAETAALFDKVKTPKVKGDTPVAATSTINPSAQPARVSDVPESNLEAAASAMVYPAQPVQGEISDPRSGANRFLIGSILLLVLVGVGLLVTDRFTGSANVAAPDIELRPNTISVSPFRPIGTDERALVISSGLYEGLSSAMTMIDDVSVVMDASTASGQATAHHLLDGSIQALGERIRVTANLTNTRTAERIWGQVYERPLDDIVAVQNNITLSLLKALQVELSDGEQARVRPINETDNIEAWLLAANALHYVRRLSPDQIERGRDLYHQALELDPDYSSAKTGLAWTHTVDLLFGWSPAPEEARQVVRDTAAFLRKTNPSFPFGHTIQALSDLMEGKHRAAKRNGLRGVKLMPASAEANALYAYILTFTGDYEEAIILTERAIELSPAKRNWVHWNLARAERLNGDPQKALQILTAAEPTEASSPVYTVERAAALARLGRTNEAKNLVEDILAIIPDFSVAFWVEHPPYDDRSDARRESELLTGIGLPE